MPRTCLACASPERQAIDRAIVTGEPLRSIAKRVSISPAGLLRHKTHVSRAIVKMQERREEKLGDSIFDGIKQLHAKALELLGQMESDGDYRGAVLAAREARECMLSANELLARAEALKSAGPSEMVVKVVHVAGGNEMQMTTG